MGGNLAAACRAGAAGDALRAAHPVAFDLPVTLRYAARPADAVAHGAALIALDEAWALASEDALGLVAEAAA